MHPSLLAARVLLAARAGWFAEGRFMGKVLDNWVDDAQDFVRLKLPRLLFLPSYHLPASFGY